MRLISFCLTVPVSLAAASAVIAQSTRPAAPPGSRHIRPIQIPSTQSAAATSELRRSLELAAAGSRSIDEGKWSFRVERDDPRDGVPWKLIATPLSDLAALLKPKEQYQPPDVILAAPILKVPENVWKAWFSPDMADVVGIHYHQFVPEETASLLITIHKVPADGPDGKPPPDYRGRPGTRLEATLLLPLRYHLDQTLVVRTDAVNAKPTKDAEHRLEHERGHGVVSLKTLIDALAGPQTWDLPKCTGRRSTMAWYYHSQKITRGWDGYHGGSGKLSTLRTTITLTPPTRWSMLIPLPPDEVDQWMIEGFNDAIVHAGIVFANMDAERQKVFHAGHGEFENKPDPP